MMIEQDTEVEIKSYRMINFIPLQPFCGFKVAVAMMVRFDYGGVKLLISPDAHLLFKEVNPRASIAVKFVNNRLKEEDIQPEHYKKLPTWMGPQWVLDLPQAIECPKWLRTWEEAEPWLINTYLQYVKIEKDAN